MKGSGPKLIGKTFFQTIFVFTRMICQELIELNADNLTKMYLDKINVLLDDTYVPLKRINKYKLKFTSKP